MRTERLVSAMSAAALLLASGLALAADYTVDPEHTRVSFEIGHLGYSNFRGRFDKTTGKVSYDPAARTGSADITVEVASVSTAVPKLDEHLKSKDFFEAARYPTITFRSSAFHFEGNELKRIDGDLTIKGVRKPVTLQVSSAVCKPHPMLKTPRCGADAETKLKRSDFGVSYGLPTLGDEVTLQINIEVVPAAK